jgi:thioredoxin reductase (NADPH)
MKNKFYTPLIILGSGPAGLTAAIYAARANLRPVLISGQQQGGQLMGTMDVENWPGDPLGVSGPNLMERFFQHARRFETQIEFDHIHTAILNEKPFRLLGDKSEYFCDALIVAMGATARYLGIPSEKEFIGRGVSACATCDGFFFRNKAVAVVGGGGTAVNEAIYLSTIATKVTLIHRRDKFRAESIAVNRLKNRVDQGYVDILYDSVVEEVLGDEDGVKGVRVRSVKDGSEKIVDVQGFFISIGHEPNTAIFKGQLDLDDSGYIITRRGRDGMVTATNIPGVFAAGDVQDPSYRQAITSAGYGCMAALDVQRYFDELG